MSDNKAKISACLVIYNEEAVIERCLLSIKSIVNEIIIVHDGECTDRSLEIAAKYTNKIFVRPHSGMMEAHLVFAFNQTTSDWLLRIDADEYFDVETGEMIKNLVSNPTASGYIFNWEMWDGKNVVTFPGLQKMSLVEKSKFHYLGIPHESGRVDGLVSKVGIVLHHRPNYNNVSWKMFMKKTRKWVPVHAEYFFPEIKKFETFNEERTVWENEAKKVRGMIWFYILVVPFKMSLGQIKNGLWKSLRGWQIAMERYVYYFMLYILVYKKMKVLKIA